VTFGVLDFVDSDGVTLAEHAVLQAPGDHVLPRQRSCPRKCENASAVSFHDSRRAQRAKNSI
jgi:hypothetical protein